MFRWLMSRHYCSHYVADSCWWHHITTFTPLRHYLSLSLLCTITRHVIIATQFSINAIEWALLPIYHAICLRHWRHHVRWLLVVVIIAIGWPRHYHYYCRRQHYYYAVCYAIIGCSMAYAIVIITLLYWTYCHHFVAAYAPYCRHWWILLLAITPLLVHWLILHSVH